MEPQRHTHQHQWRSRPLLALAALLTTAIAAPVIAAPAAQAKVRVRVVAASRDYSISIPADAQVVAAGGTATYPLILRTGSRFRGAVFFEVVGLPAGVSTRVVSLGRNSFNLQLTTAPNLPSSSTVSILRAISAGRVREALLRLTINGAPPVTQPPATVPPVTAPPPTAPPQTVPPAPVFGLVVNTPQNTASTDQQVQYFVNVDRSAGYQGNVTFYVSGLPAGTTGGFGPNPTTAGTVLYVTPGQSTPGGTYVLGITAQAGPSVRTTAVILIVKAQTDFVLGVIPSAMTLAAGQSGVVALDVRPNVAGAAVSLEISGLPGGVTAKFAKTSTTGPTTLTINTKLSAPGGTYPLTITGRSGSFVRTTTLQLTVQNTAGFGLTANPPTVIIGHPGTNASLILITPTGGFSGTVSITVLGLPAGVTPSVGATNGGAYLTLSVAGTVAPGTYAFTVTGTSGTLSATIGLSLQVV